MAIIFTEKENKGLITFLIISSIIFIVTAIMFYYLFLMAPPVVELQPNPGLDAAIIFSKAAFDINVIIDSPIMQILEEELLVPSPPTEIIDLKTNLFESF